MAILDWKYTLNPTHDQLLLYYFTQVFHTESTGGFSLEFKRQQVSSGLKDSSKYSTRCLQFCSREGINSSSNASSLLLKSTSTIPSAPTTIRITVIFTFHSFSSYLTRARYFVSFSFVFAQWPVSTAKYTC